MAQPQPDLHRNRLPTLFEVLSRRTLPPVDVFNFYIYMRDQQRSVDYLDFWLDVAQHMSLCRHYVRELRRTIMIGTPSIGGNREPRPSFMRDIDSTSPSPREGLHEGDKDSPRLSPMIDEATPEPPESLETSEGGDAARKNGASKEPAETSGAHSVERQSTNPSLDPRDADEQIADLLLRGGSSGSRRERLRNNLSMTSVTSVFDRHNQFFLQRDKSESPPGSRASRERVRQPSFNSHTSWSSAILEGLGNIDSFAAGPSRAYATDKERDQDVQISSFLREELGDGVSPPASHSPSNNVSRSNASRSDTIARVDIRESAEKILYTYLLPGSERELALPNAITREITTGIEEQGRDDPELFEAAKDYVFQAMERDAFPGFLRMKSLGNLVPPQLLIRRLLGLVCFFAGFWTAFVLIFLDEPRRTRTWLVLPFTFGVYSLVSHEFALDPLLVLFGMTEHTLFAFDRIREPYVKQLLTKRAIVVLVLVTAIDAVLLAIFILVPGQRL